MNLRGIKTVTTHWRRIAGSTVVVLLAFALCRAASFRFTEMEEAYREFTSKELAKLGISRNAAKAKYPTPYITSVSPTCVLPGGTAEVVVKGTFVPGSKFFFENDNLQVVKESLTGGEYRATVKAAPGIGPQTANLVVITPVTAISAQHLDAVNVGGRYEWTMKAANGWKLVARSADSQPCAAPSTEGTKYEILFYRPGESTPFERRDANLVFSMWEQSNYLFTISQDDPAVRGMGQKMSALSEKLSDPNLPDTEREKFTAQLEKLQEQGAAIMSDPAFIERQQAKQAEFGCESIDLQVPAGGGIFSGQMRCAPDVGLELKLTGSMKAAQ
ncbi:MAG: hypothetical protein ABFD89_02385 [Bryobacteraceae bacterium]